MPRTNKLKIGKRTFGKCPQKLFVGLYLKGFFVDSAKTLCRYIFWSIFRQHLSKFYFLNEVINKKILKPSIKLVLGYTRSSSLLKLNGFIKNMKNA